MFFFAAFVVCVATMITDAHHIPVEMVDLSHTLDETTLNWPGVMKFKMMVTVNQTIKGEYWLQLEDIAMGTHIGTHMCAPCHFSPGKWCIDQIPLNRLKAHAAVIDITYRAEEDADALVEVRDLLKWERISGQTLNHTIVMMKSGWSKRWPDRKAFTGTAGNDTSKFHFPGMSERAAQWLVDNRDIYGVGSETISLDNGASAGIFMAHRTLLPKNIYCIENVAHLDKIPIYGATVYAFPIKIGNGGGAPVRLFATFPKVKFSHD